MDFFDFIDIFQAGLYETLSDRKGIRTYIGYILLLLLRK